jgi:conjugal transfer ATP-binding protein TraC
MSHRPLKLFSEFQLEHALCHELPYWEVQDDAIILADGTLVKGARLTGLAIECLDTDQINQLALDLRGVLNSLSEYYEISIVSEVNGDFASVVNRHCELANGNPLLEPYVYARTEAFNDDLKTGRLLKRNLHLFVYRRPESEQRGFFQSFLKPPKKFVEIKKANVEKSIKEFSQQCAEISQLLHRAKIGSNWIGATDAISIIFRFFNPKRSQSHPAPKINTKYRDQEFTAEEIKLHPSVGLPTLREQLVFSDLIKGYDGFYLDGFYHRLITLKTLPEVTHATMISRLMALPFHHSLQVHVRVPAQSKEQSLLQIKRRMAHSMSSSHNGKATDLESEAKLTSTEELLRELIATGQKIFYFQLSVLLRNPSKENLEAQTKEVLSTVRELDGAEATAETVANLAVFKSVMPFGLLKMVRPKRVKSDNLADLLPVYEPSEGRKHERPVRLYRNRFGGLVAHDPFGPGLTNANVLITGSSGAGKSFVSNLDLLQDLSQDILVTILDNGASYEKLCEYFGGQYVRPAPPDSNQPGVKLNLFALPKGQTKPSDRKLQSVLGFVENILSDEDGGKLSKLDKSLLQQAILELYDECQGHPTLSDFSKKLALSSERSLKRFQKMLYPWTGDRPYGRLLDGQNEFNFTNNLVVFDFKGLIQFPDLQSVILSTVVDFTLGRVDVKNRKKRTIIDEGWEILKFKGTQNLIEYCVRTQRKENGGITFLTQGLEEVLSSSIGPAIVSSTATKQILLQRGDLEPARNLLRLNNQEMALIRSLSQVKGQYSESFLIADESRSVIQICPTPLEYWLATSDPNDKALLERTRNENPKFTIHECIAYLAKYFPYGSHGVQS